MNQPRMHVSVRLKPLSPEDAESSPWRISGNSIYIPNQPTWFKFDRVFGEESRTVDIYEASIQNIVSAAVQGFNGAVFAYGQTGSGKTHTMTGSPIEPGVIPMAVQDLFKFIEEEMDREFFVRMSYMEIYNDQIIDLLSPKQHTLQVRECQERGIFVDGLTQKLVGSPDQVLEFSKLGECHRHTGETRMNLQSSRSHMIFQMIIESRKKAEDTDSATVRVSVLNLVDLGGSERAAKSGAEGLRRMECTHINKSLMTLGTVISKLNEGAASEGGHIPYRDSKLTRILQPALGGNANTAIICNITLAQIHIYETKSSLQFATRALGVTNCAHVNEASHPVHNAEEIFNLQSALRKSELEREKIALELEEEKKAHADKEKMLEEQAKIMESLSAMVQDCDAYKKENNELLGLKGDFAELLSKFESHKKANQEKIAHLESKISEVDLNESKSSREDEVIKQLEEKIAVLEMASLRQQNLDSSVGTENDQSTSAREEYEQVLVENRSMHEQVEILTRAIADSGNALKELSEKYEAEKTEYLTQIQTLQEEVKKLEGEKTEYLTQIQTLQEEVKKLEGENAEIKHLMELNEIRYGEVLCSSEKTLFRSYTDQDQMYLPADISRKISSPSPAILYCNEKRWDMQVAMTEGRGGVYKLHRGWRIFVEENGLDVGDVVKFELLKTVDSSRVVFRVSIVRKGSSLNPIDV